MKCLERGRYTTLRLPYSASKAASDHFVRAYGRTYGLLYTLSYGSNTYGPGQNEEKLIPRCLRSCYEKTAIPLYGSGENMRRWLYVEEHARAIWQILASMRRQALAMGLEEEKRGAIFPLRSFSPNSMLKSSESREVSTRS